MPAIASTLFCTNCGELWVGPEKKLFIVSSDGEESRYRGPPLIASFEEAIKGKQTIYRYALLCRVCTEIDFYGPKDLGLPESTHVEILATQKYRCKNCQSYEFFLVQEERLSIQRFLRWVGLLPESSYKKNICPKCRTGRLSVSRNIFI